MAVIGGARIALCVSLSVSATAPSSSGHAEDAGGGRKLVLQCSLGETAVCRTLTGNPRLAPGTREAIAELLVAIEKNIVACEAGNRDACAALIERYPSLPAPVRDAARLMLEGSSR